MRKELFNKDEEQVKSQLTVNRDFKQRFEHNKQREELDRLKQKYGKDFVEHAAEDQASSSISEDDDGVLVDDNVMIDFMQTFSKIKNKHPDIYEKDNNFFNIDVENLASNSANKDQKYTIKQQIAENIKEGRVEDEDYDTDEKLIPIKEEKKLKDAFKLAADTVEHDDDFLTKRELSKEERKKEDVRFNEFLEKHNKKIKPDDAALLHNFWGAEENLNSDDKFLRDYLLRKRWVDKDNEGFNMGQVDAEDDLFEDKVDEFEHKHNFRFEEEGGTEIATYSRNITDTLRDTKNKRKEQREREKQKKQEVMNDMKKEIEFAKKAQKDKIVEKIIKLKKVSGNRDPNYEKMIREALENDFDENYDKIMAQVFDDEYYEQEEEDNNEIEQYLDNVEQEFDKGLGNNNKHTNPEKEELAMKEKEEGLLPKANLPLHLRHNINNEEAQQIQQATNQGLWWYCDNCHKGIQPLEQRYDCFDCSDYTLCRKCYEMRIHEHKMKKFIVPECCVPATDDEIAQIIKNFKYCHICQEKVLEVESYYQHKSKDDIYCCKNCIYVLTEEYKLRDFKQIKPKKSQNKEMDELFDEYNNIDFEDVISGGIKTRYSYIDVPADDFGLTDAEIFFADEKILNQMISIKKLAPYRDSALTSKDRTKLRKLRWLVRESAEINQRKFAQEMEVHKQEAELKELSKKNKKYKKQYDQFMQDKEKIISDIYADSEDLLKKLKYKQNKMRDKNDESIPQVTGGVITEDRLKSYGIKNK